MGLCLSSICSLTIIERVTINRDTNIELLYLQFIEKVTICR